MADAQAQTEANAAQGDPTVVQPPLFVDTGESKRQAARDMLNPARQRLSDVDDSTAQTLRAQAQLAPQDSLKQSDADFFGGIWDTISGAGESVLGLITDPLGTAEAIKYNITHPVETLKDLVAWDDWANGEEDRALGKIVGGLLLGGGAGKLAKSLLRRRDRDDGDDDGGDKTPAPSPEDIGAARERKVAELTNGTVPSGAPGRPGRLITRPGVGTTDIDVIGADGSYIQVGGPRESEQPQQVPRQTRYPQVESRSGWCGGAGILGRWDARATRSGISSCTTAADFSNRWGDRDGHQPGGRPMNSTSPTCISPSYVGGVEFTSTTVVWPDPYLLGGSIYTASIYTHRDEPPLA